MLGGIGRHIGNHPQRRRGRADIGAARQVLFDDVILNCTLQGGNFGTLFFGHGDIEGEQPRGGGIDGHRGIHLVEGNVGEQCPHIAQVSDGHADFAHLATRQNVVAVVADLSRQIEGDGQPGLPACEVATV